MLRNNRVRVQRVINLIKRNLQLPQTRDQILNPGEHREAALLLERHADQLQLTDVVRLDVVEALVEVLVVVVGLQLRHLDLDALAVGGLGDDLHDGLVLLEADEVVVLEVELHLLELLPVREVVGQLFRDFGAFAVLVVDYFDLVGVGEVVVDRVLVGDRHSVLESPVLDFELVVVVLLVEEDFVVVYVFLEGLLLGAAVD